MVVCQECPYYQHDAICLVGMYYKRVSPGNMLTCEGVTDHLMMR